MNILNTLLVNSIVFSILFAIMILVRKRFSKKISIITQYFLWGVILLKLLIPFGFENSLLPKKPVGYSPINIEQKNQAFNNADSSSENNSPEKTDLKQEAVKEQSSAPVEENKIQTKTAKKNINWAQIILAIWIFGMAVMLNLLIYSYVLMIRQIRKSQVLPLPHVLECFENCLVELGIKREIEIIMQDSFSVPAITGIIKPKLILPSSLNHSSEITIQNVCMHELTHFKYGDLYTICFLNLINIVYWFHPLVWKSVALIRQDMEAVCDFRVTKKIGETESYVQTILYFASRQSYTKIKAALTMSTGGKTSMEERIKNLFRIKKSSRKARILVCTLAIFMVGVSVLTACRPIGSVVSGAKKMDYWEGKFRKNEDNPNDKKLSELLHVPKKINSNFEKNKVKINFDADTIIPDASAAPVAKAKVLPHSQEQANKIIDVFCGDVQLYEYQGQTKEQLKESIDLYEKELERLKEQNGSPQDIEIMQGEIQDKKEMAKGAIFEADKQKVDSQFKKDGMVDNRVYEYINGEFKTENGWREIHISNDYGGQSMVKLINTKGELFRNYYMRYDSNDRAMPEKPANVKMTKEQAIAEAQKIMKQLDSNFKVDFVGVGTTGLFGRPEKDKEGWAVVLTKAVNGVDTTFDVSNNRNYTWEQSNDCDYETVTLYFDDQGLACFDWKGNTEIGEILNNNVSLLDFTEIEKVAKEKMADKVLKYLDKNEVEAINVNINSIKLGMMRVTTYEKEYIMVPVWDFFGDLEVKFNNGYFEKIKLESDNDENLIEDLIHPYPKKNHFRNSILTINAIDGTEIERIKGYLY